VSPKKKKKRKPDEKGHILYGSIYMNVKSIYMNVKSIGLWLPRHRNKQTKPRLLFGVVKNVLKLDFGNDYTTVNH
jgi:hypothetical protein